MIACLCLSHIPYLILWVNSQHCSQCSAHVSMVFGSSRNCLSEDTPTFIWHRELLPQEWLWSQRLGQMCPTVPALRRLRQTGSEVPGQPGLHSGDPFLKIKAVSKQKTKPPSPGESETARDCLAAWLAITVLTPPLLERALQPSCQTRQIIR